MKREALFGSAGAGYYVWVVVSFLALLFFAMFLFIYMPMAAAYRFKPGQLLKNCFYSGLIVFVTTLILVLILAGIPLIAIASEIVMYLIYGFFLLFGFTLYLLIITAYGQYVCENLIEAQLDLQEEQEAKKAEQERKAAAKQQAAKQPAQNRSAVAAYKKNRKAKQQSARPAAPVQTEGQPAFITEEEAQKLREEQKAAQKPVYKGGPYNKGKKKH